PDHATNAGRLRACIDPGHKQLAVIGTDQCRYCADEGRLPGTVRAEQGGYVAGLGDEIETIQCRDVAETLAQPACFDDRRHRLAPSLKRIGMCLLSERDRSK